MVPDGLTEGDSMTCAVGAICFDIVVPDGCGPGSTILVHVPAEDDPPTLVDAGEADSRGSSTEDGVTQQLFTARLGCWWVEERSVEDVHHRCYVLDLLLQSTKPQSDCWVRKRDTNRFPKRMQNVLGS